VAATRARAALSSLLAWAIREGLAKDNAVIGTNRPAPPKSRDRVLTIAELGRIWKACRDDDYGRIIQLLMLTGQRRDEVGAMTWVEVDLDSGRWIIPAERTKNNRPHTIALSPLALSILGKTARREGNDRVFGKGVGGFSGWSKAKVALDGRISGARDRPVQTRPIPPWTVHDIRRSVATHMAEIGILPHVVEAILNHVSGHKAGIAGIYNRSKYEREAGAALAIWADQMNVFVDGGAPKVIPFASEH